ncbi:MAG: polysaccharide biosynthesis/export family protein [Thermostichales cyanobacterium HHBFW_bins_127]
MARLAAILGTVAVAVQGGLASGQALSPLPRLDVVLEQQEGLYRLGPGDNVQIDVFGVPEFSGAQRILVDGTVTLPNIGSVVVQGLTLKQAADELALRLAAIVQRPLVTVRVLEARPLRIAVVGEVNRPGAYVVTAVGTAAAPTAAGARVTPVAIPTVSQLIQTAGGITQAADIRRVQVKRRQVRGTDQLFSLNLWELVTTGDLSRDLVLLDGDTVFVPTAAPPTFSELTQLGVANLSPDTIRVSVVGQVVRPGTVDLPNNSSLNQAVLAAGGITRTGDPNRVELFRLNVNGTVTAQQVSLDYTQPLNPELNPPLRNADVIVVNRSAISEATETLSTIFDPFLRLRAVINLFN